MDVNIEYDTKIAGVVTPTFCSNDNPYPIENGYKCCETGRDKDHNYQSYTGKVNTFNM